MDFRTFVRTLGLRWKLVAGSMLACLLGAAALTALQTKQYQASATILVSFSGVTSFADVASATEASQKLLSSYAAIAGGYTVAQRAVDELHVPVSAGALAGQTQVAYTPETMLFTITVRDTDPNRVAALAGAMADRSQRWFRRSARVLVRRRPKIPGPQSLPPRSRHRVSHRCR